MGFSASAGDQWVVYSDDMALALRGGVTRLFVRDGAGGGHGVSPKHWEWVGLIDQATRFSREDAVAAVLLAEELGATMLRVS